ncbi:MAG: PKD domain-containing protein [Candidatus Korarchaeota archaeon]|nr:PKD domain-containing protein [Candidatus Korarchaeota archaeon]
MRATEITLILALLVLMLMTVAVSADTGCPAVDSSTDVAPEVVEIAVYKINGRTVELIGVVEDPDSGLREWIWDFGDGTIVKKTGGWSKTGNSTYKMVVKHTYSDYRSYTVKLQVIDDWLKESSVKTKLVTIKKSNYRPIVRLKRISPNPAQPGKEVVFEVEGIDPDGQVVAYEWDFGDGKKTEGANLTRVTHSYSKEGTYVVKVKVKDDKGAYSDPVTEEVYIRSQTKPKPENKPPTIVKVEFTPVEPSIGVPVTFRVTASDPEGDKLTFQWNFGDGTVKSGGPRMSHTYKKEGAYTVKVRAVDSKGASSTSYTVSVAVRGNKPPQASIVEVRTRDNITFMFQGMGIDPDGQVLAYEWDFGDGKKTEGELKGNSIPHRFISHTYVSSGNYTVKFRVKDDKGAWSSWISKRVTASVQGRVSSASWAGFDFSNLEIAAGLGTLIVVGAGYLAYRESKSNAFIERSKEKAKRYRKVTVKRPAMRRNKRDRSSVVRKRRRPWPAS